MEFYLIHVYVGMAVAIQLYAIQWQMNDEENLETSTMKWPLLSNSSTQLPDGQPHKF